MRWSMDVHKYMSNITRKALQILAERNITSESEPEEIDAAERALASAGVYKSYDGAKGRIRRALFTYFRAYDCMDENEHLTEIGKAFIEGKITVQEISFLYVINYKYKEDDLEYYPLQLLLKYITGFEKESDAFISAIDFSRLVQCNSIDDVNSQFVSDSLKAREKGNIVNERSIGYDVWAKMLSQAGLFSLENHILVLRNRQLAEWALAAYEKPITAHKGSISAGIVEYIPLILPVKPRLDPMCYSNEGKAIGAFLFDGVSDRIIDKYLVSKDDITISDIRLALGISGQHVGFYEEFSGLEHIVGYSLINYGTNLQKIIGEILINEEITELQEIKKGESKELNLPELAPRRRKQFPLNCILYGAPGTGKTYATAQYAVAIAEGRSVKDVADEERSEIISRYNDLINNGRIVFTTFHQNYGYEDFIQGIRPDTSTAEMTFKPVDGVFKEIADRAINDPDNDYIIIIDEINRANISKVFGELITLIEEDKRWGEENAICVTLPLGGIFAVPNNLYIVGTMNSADKSISLIDTALRRRFDFIEYVPDLDKISDNKLRKVLKTLNEGLKAELNSTDLLVGHSYFMNRSIEDLCEIMNRNIIPLLYEYFFDNQKKVEAQVKKATEGLDVEVKSNTLGRIKLVEKETE